MLGIAIVPLRELQYAYCAGVQHFCMHAFYISGNVQYTEHTENVRSSSVRCILCFQSTNPASEDIAITSVYFTLTAHFSTPGQHHLQDHFQGLKIMKKKRL